MAALALVGFVGLFVSGVEPSNVAWLGVITILMLFYSSAAAWSGEAERAVLHPVLRAFVVVSGTFIGYKTGLGIASMHGNAFGTLPMVEAWIIALVFFAAIVLPYRALRAAALAVRSGQE